MVGSHTDGSKSHELNNQIIAGVVAEDARWFISGIVFRQSIFAATGKSGPLAANLTCRYYVSAVKNNIVDQCRYCPFGTISTTSGKSAVELRQLKITRQVKACTGMLV